MKYWSEAEGCFIECESVWDGRGSVTASEGWVYRSSYLAQTDRVPDERTRAQQAHIERRKKGLNYAPSDKRKPNRCACGNTKSVRADRCKACFQLTRPSNTIKVAAIHQQRKLWRRDREVA